MMIVELKWISLKAIALLLLIALSGCSSAATSQAAGTHTAGTQTTGELSVAELLSLGEKYLLELDYEQAIVYFTRVIEIDPRNVRAFIGRGDTYVRWNEQFTLAQADYEMALEIDEMSVDAFLGLADIFIRQGDWVRAEEILRLGLERTSDNRIREKLDEFASQSVTDSEGRVRIRNYFTPDGTLAFYMYELGVQADGTSRTNEYAPDGRLQQYHIHSRSEDGLERYSESYTADGTLNRRGVQVYDANERWLYTTSSGQGAEDDSRTVAVYDEQDELIGWDNYWNGELYGWVRIEDGRNVFYDADGNMTMYTDN